jgi:DNA polymerase-3 subunit alpha
LINFRTYSRYSIKTSIAKIEDIVTAAQVDGDKSVAIVDRDGLHSTIYLTKAAKKADLNPVIGYEFREYLTLWPLTHNGLRNLNKISSIDSRAKSLNIPPENLDLTDIAAIYNPCLALNGADFNKLTELSVLFKDRLYVEVQNNNTLSVNKKFAEEHSLPLIPTSNVFYNTRSDALAHDYYRAYTVGDGVHLDNDEYFIKSKKDFYWAHPQWIKNAEELACRIKLDVVLGKLRLPEFDGAPQNTSNFDFLEQKCQAALVAKNLHIKSDAYVARLKHELQDVKNAHLESYFLIVEDICRFAKDNGIKKGKGRGSGAGSLICYLLGITGIDPLQYGLIWERFYNAGRAGSLPDIDTDFEKDRREEVISYITKRWGEDKVYQIITFGSFGPAKAITVALNIGQCGFEEQKEVSKLIHHKAKTIAEAIKMSPELKAEAERRKALFAIAQKLEGAFDAFGKHAAGIIIADEPFMNGGLPMKWHGDDGKYISGYDLGAVEDYGLLKMDCLGINTLNVIKECETLIKERHNPLFDMDTIPLDDKDVYESIFEDGKTKCVFQLESQLGKKYSSLLKPKNISEIADLITVVRPGAMEPGQTQKYLDVRNGVAQPNYIHPKLEKVLGETYSSCIYQEQVMQICTDIAGLDLKSADNVRKAAGKKKPELMEKQKKIFLDGCKKHNVKDEVADTLWSWIVEFSGYGFNKSHAVAYAFMSYDTAYLKHHYPLEFFEASCNHAIGDIHRSVHDKLKEIIYDAKDFNIDIVLPSIKTCNISFKKRDDKSITYGLSKIKDIGDAQLPLIEKCKDTKTFPEFLSTALNNKLNKKTIEALICSGALDSFGLTRNTMLADYELLNALTDREFDALTKEINSCNSNDVVESIKEMSDDSKEQERKARGLIVPAKNRRAKLRDIILSYKSKDKFESILHIAMYERKFLGCDISVNETDSFFSSITHNLAEIKKIKNKTKVKTAIHIDGIRKIVTKKGKTPGQEMAFITGSDGTSICDSIVVFPTQFQKFKSLLTEGRVVYIDGEISETGGLIVNNMGILN